MIDDTARKTIEAELHRLEAEIHKEYQRAYDELLEKWKKNAEVLKSKAEPFDKEIAEARKAGDRDRVGELTKAKNKAVYREAKLNKAYKRRADQLSYEIAHTQETAVNLVNRALPQVYSIGYNSLAGSLPSGYAYGVIQPDMVRKLLKQELDFYKAEIWNRQKMTNELLQGILQGESMDKIAARFEKVLGMSESQAIRNARTAVTYAENNGRFDSFKAAEDRGTVLVKVWYATHDSRTRDSHSDIDRTEKPLDEPFDNGLMYPGDPDGAGEEVYNCRCAMGTRIIGYKRADGSILYI